MFTYCEEMWKEKIYVVKADMKKRRDEIKKTLNYTLDEFIDAKEQDNKTLNETIKIKPGTDNAINITLLNIKNLYERLSKVVTWTDSEQINDNIANCMDEFFNKPRMIKLIQ